jgi:hypothetical protein
MAKLYWVSMTVSNAGGATSPEVLSGIITESAELPAEDERATIEDNQDIQIALSGGVSFESRNLTFDGGSDAVLDDSRVNTDGATKARVVMTANTGATATLDQVYLNVRKKIISTGEVGLMVDAKRTDEVSSDPLVYA